MSQKNSPALPCLTRIRRIDACSPENLVGFLLEGFHDRSCVFQPKMRDKHTKGETTSRIVESSCGPVALLENLNLWAFLLTILLHNPLIEATFYSRILQVQGLPSSSRYKSRRYRFFRYQRVSPEKQLSWVAWNLTLWCCYCIASRCFPLSMITIHVVFLTLNSPNSFKAFTELGVKLNQTKVALNSMNQVVLGSSHPSLSSSFVNGVLFCDWSPRKSHDDHQRHFGQCWDHFVLHWTWCFRYLA